MKRICRMMSLCILAILFLGAQGCWTRMAWRESLENNAYLKRYYGVGMTPNNDSNSFLVSYGDTEYIYAIPLRDGHVLELFEYNGTKTKSEDILADIPPERLEQIINYKFPRKWYVSQRKHRKTREIPLDIKTWEMYRETAPRQPVCNVFLYNSDSATILRSRAFILPAKQKRFLYRQGAQIAYATLCTPILLTGDTVAIIYLLITSPSDVKKYCFDWGSD